jgi:hypothetical protein
MHKERTFTWQFPLPRTHTGLPLGNGTMGALLWGEENVLRITLSRTDFWDHRGGLPWNEQMTFEAISELLHKADEAGLKAMFREAPLPEGNPRRPSVLPVGRLELIFPEGWHLSSAILKLENGEADVTLLGPDRKSYLLTVRLSMAEPLLYVNWPEGAPRPRIEQVSAWKYVGEYLRSISFEEPAFFSGTELSGWVQQCPVDPALCIGWRQSVRGLWCTLVYGAEPDEAIAAARTLIEAALTTGAEPLQRENTAWWNAYWESVPRISVPNGRLDFRYYLGMYRFAGLTAPQGVAATLQGPWIEEYQMPPWSSDFHFNINVQMCYWPAYRGNRLEHLRPLFEMVWNWREQLRQNARFFLGIEDGLMLPHAVDDHSTNMGGFWSGTVDHGCTAWVAKMLYDYWLYGGGDETFLREVAYPFMFGAMRVYEEMLTLEGDHYVLPVSVSPEYRSSQIDAWGRNASFQLACIHWLCESLQHASSVLGETPRPIWGEIQQKLPRACVEGEPGREQIMLWEGTPLEESHRHHSHLAGLVPFDVFDPTDESWQRIIQHSILHWISQGMGRWSGWCMPWAAMLQTYMGHADAAELTMEIWDRLFTNEGYNTLHDVAFPGISLTGWPPRKDEIMQMDAAMSATAAVMEMLLQTRRGVHYLFAGAPRRWKDVSFERVRTEGAFLVSARRIDGRIPSVHIISERAGRFRLANPWGRSALLIRGEQRTQLAGEILDVDAPAGEVIVLVPAE